MNRSRLVTALPLLALAVSMGEVGEGGSAGMGGASSHADGAVGSGGVPEWILEGAPGP
jgi:hypothetical protein